jgi:hypothetical protein
MGRCFALAVQEDESLFIWRWGPSGTKIKTRKGPLPLANNFRNRQAQGAVAGRSFPGTRYDGKSCPFSTHVEHPISVVDTEQEKAICQSSFQFCISEKRNPISSILSRGLPCHRKARKKLPTAWLGGASTNRFPPVP